MSKRRTYQQQDYDYDDDLGSSYEFGSYEYKFGSVPDSPVSKSFEQCQFPHKKRNPMKSPEVEFKSPVVTRKPISKKEEMKKLKEVVAFLQANGGDLEDPSSLEEIARRNNFDIENSLADMRYFQFSGDDDVRESGGSGGGGGRGGGGGGDFSESNHHDHHHQEEEYFGDGYGEFLPPPPPNGEEEEGEGEGEGEKKIVKVPVLEEEEESGNNRTSRRKKKNRRPFSLEVPSKENNPVAIPVKNNMNNNGSNSKNGNNNNKKNKKRKKNNNSLSPGQPKKVRQMKRSATPLPDISKTRLSVVIVGHVDAGKSTLVGQLLVQCGVVDPKTLRAYRKQANDIGKGSFYLAWVTDEDREERSRGVTVHLGIKQFETDNKLVTILDSPGHRDFVPNMIMGASQADVGVLVIDAVKGAFEAGFKSRGQTREHVLVSSCLGVKNWIVVVNKMDMVNWAYKRFQEIEAMLTNWMVGVLRLKKRSIKFIPISGLGGVNITKKVINEPERLCRWYKNKKCLLDLIDEIRPLKRMTNKPLRMSLHDVFKTKYEGVFVAGTVDTGVIFKGDRLEIHPINEIVTIKKIKRLNREIEKCFSGDYVELNISGNTEYQSLQIGQILCPPKFPISYSQKFKVTMITFDVEFPVIRGTEVIIHLLNKMVSGTVHKILSIMNKRREVTIRRPRFVPKNSMSSVVLTTQNPICLELFSNSKTYGTLIIRKDGDTIASGIVTKIFPVKN